MQAKDIKAGLDIFAIPQPAYKELMLLERDLDLLQRLWGLATDWEASYAAWKNGLFSQLKAGSVMMSCGCLQAACQQ